MNTRLQVEHPVTELITGIDLVKEQIRVAEGHKLPFTQDDLKISGHAIELRVCAEDPMNNFLPVTGTLLHYVRPQGPGIRVDDGFEQGMEIPIYYDPMIAKLIAYGEDRTQAIERLKRAIDEYVVSGISTTLSFGKWVMDHPAFRDGNFDTGFIAKFFNPETTVLHQVDKDEEAVAAIIATQIFSDTKKNSKGTTNDAVVREPEEWTSWYKRRKKFL